MINNVQAMVNLQLNMFLMMIVGFILRNSNIIGAEGKKNITDLVIDVVLPANIIKAFMIEFNKELLVRFALIFIISLLVQLVATTMASHCYNKMPDSRKKIFQYGTVCSNAGFMGNVVAEQVFGTMGLAYASIFLVPQRIVMWSAGVSYFTEGTSKKEVLKKLITHPCIIAVFIGLILMFTQLPLPGFLEDSITAISGSCTFLSMMLIGMILVGADLKTLFEKSIFVYSALRLIILPLAVFIGCQIFRIDALVTGVCTLLVAMPAGATTAILAAKYNGDEIFASKCVVFSTALSLITTPIWSVILLSL